MASPLIEDGQRHSHWGNDGFASAGDLPNVAGSIIQQTSLQTGDTAYVPSGADAGLWYCTVSTLGAAVWAKVGAGTSGIRRVYGDGRLTIAGTPFSATFLDFANNTTSSGGCRQVFDQFGEYTLCRWRITVADNTGILSQTDDLMFPNAAALVAWVQANVPNNGSTYLAASNFEVYDYVTSTVQPVSKVFGFNLLYKQLLRAGDKRYLSPQTGAFVPNILPQAATVLDALWGATWGTPLSTTIGVAPGLWGAAEFSLFWHHRSKKSLYSIPNPSALELRGTRNRGGLLGGVITPATGGWRSDPAPRPEEWGYVRTSGIMNSLQAWGKSSSPNALKPSMLDGYTHLIGIPIWNPTTGHQAMYVKPVGIDHVYTTAWDSTRYRLEWVGTLNHRHYPRLWTTSKIEFNSAEQRCAGPFNAQYWRPLWGGGPGMVGRADFYQPGQVRFQLRDLATNEVSPLSIAAVTGEYKRRGAPFSWLVRNVPSY